MNSNYSLLESQSQQKQPFALYKKVIQQTPISKTYNIFEKSTSKIWKAKVFNLTKVQQISKNASEDFQDVIQFNGEVLTQISSSEQIQNDHCIYLETVFVKDDKQVHVLQMYEERLSKYLQRKYPKGMSTCKGQVVKILKDCFRALCEVYQEDYMVLNLRPQHFVWVKDDENKSDQEGKWKIQSFVSNYAEYPGLKGKKSEYIFDYDWASNEQKNKKEDLEDDLKDQQIVWYLGVMALRLIYGCEFKINWRHDDTDFNMKQIKELSDPSVYQLISKCVKANLKDRISIKDIFQLKIFSDEPIAEMTKRKFKECAKQRFAKSIILKQSAINKSTLRKSSLKQSLKIKLTESRQTNTVGNSSAGLNQKLSRNNSEKLINNSAGLLSQGQSENLYNEIRWLYEKSLYIGGQVKHYTQSNAIYSDMLSKEDIIVIRYVYLRIAWINLKTLRTDILTDRKYMEFRQGANSKPFYEKIIKEIEQNQTDETKSIEQQYIRYTDKIKKLNTSNLKALGQISSLKDDIVKLKTQLNQKEQELMSEESKLMLIGLFKSIAGAFYTTIKKKIDEQKQASSSSDAPNDKLQNMGIKNRAMCFYVFSAYILMACENSLATALTDFKQYRTKYYDKEELEKGSIHVKFQDEELNYIRLCEYNDKADDKVLIEHSQKILKKYFQVEDNSSSNNNVLLGINNSSPQNKRRPSIYADKNRLSVS